jgi:hypothetical protein
MCIYKDKNIPIEEEKIADRWKEYVVSLLVMGMKSGFFENLPILDFGLWILG